MGRLDRGTAVPVAARRFALAAAFAFLVSACSLSAVPTASTTVIGAASPAASVVVETSTAPPASPVASVVVITPSPLATPTAASTASPTPRPKHTRSPRPTTEATATPTTAATATPTPTPTPPPALPDLIVKSFSVPTTVMAGQEATGAMYVQNVGSGDAGAFDVDIFGSCPGEVMSEAPKPVSGLAPGAEKFLSVKFTFQNTGDCTIGAELDSANVVAESNEDNNTVTQAITSQ